MQELAQELVINGAIYELKTTHSDEKLIIGIIDNRGLTVVGYSTLERFENGFIKIKNARCLVKWWTGAHLNHLKNGVCEGVALGAKADILVSDLYYVLELPFKTMEDWLNTKISKGSLLEF